MTKNGLLASAPSGKEICGMVEQYFHSLPGTVSIVPVENTKKREYHVKNTKGIVDGYIVTMKLQKGRERWFFYYEKAYRESKGE